MTAARIFRIGFILAATPLLLAACNVRYDDNHNYNGYRTEGVYPSASAPPGHEPPLPPVPNHPPPQYESFAYPQPDNVPLQPYPTLVIPEHPPGLPPPANPAGVGEPNGRLPFGLRLDPNGDPNRKVRAENLAGDPRVSPSPRDLREARAFTQAQADLYQQGGGIKYRADGSANNPKDVDYISEKRALQIEYHADPCLNSADGTPHALALIVYHLSNRNAFDRLAKSEDGKLILLEGEEFDESVKGVERFTLQPGEAGNWELDRPEDGKYVAIVAGYPDVKTYVKEYGLGNWTKKGKVEFGAGFGVKTSTEMFMPLPLSLRMDLGTKTMLVLNTDRIYDHLRGVARLTASEFRYASTAAIFPK